MQPLHPLSGLMHLFMCLLPSVPTALCALSVHTAQCFIVLLLSVHRVTMPGRWSTPMQCVQEELGKREVERGGPI